MQLKQRAQQRPAAAAAGGAAAAAARRRCRPSVAAASSASSSPSSPSPPSPADELMSLPLFELPSVLLPAQQGSLVVYEPRYLALFAELQAGRGAAATANAAAAPQPPPRFGHIISRAAAPPALLADGGGFAPLGVVAEVRRVTPLDGGGRLRVDYEGVARFSVLGVDEASRPYPVAAAARFADDEPVGAAAREAALLERELDRLLGVLQRYAAEEAREQQRQQQQGQQDQDQDHQQQQRGGGSGGGIASSSAPPTLPPGVAKYAPPPEARASGVGDYLHSIGHPAGAAILTWQRHGSVYGDVGANQSQQQRKKTYRSPYEELRERVAGARRQELFSFAAADALELGAPERLALLQSRSLCDRLSFVLAAVQPYVQMLAARSAVTKAVTGR